MIKQLTSLVASKDSQIDIAELLGKGDGDCSEEDEKVRPAKSEDNCGVYMPKSDECVHTPAILNTYSVKGARSDGP